ncbi:telomerase reverse transcriptase [Salvia miltiorrhiza]|uniref:telomerase reverse transcriptase n=1 Tax=Salvia miltiorrhiza TaxID=226208 RepID=UPI0025AC0DCD|nr:telomerase reverse transcriptase [Salvia miltiorrhiza]
MQLEISVNTPSALMAAKKRKRVPEVLWRLFENQARTLADTIAALIPPPSDTATDKAMSFLVRSGDPLDYRKLLSECFVVVSEDAPSIPVFDPHRRWSQCEIVRRSIEIILHEQPSSSNLICCNYDKESRSSPVVDELSSSKWTLLLTRVGDAVMMYLLKYTSMFCPLPHKKHHQISGCPIDSLCSKFSKDMPKSRVYPCAYAGYKAKRQRVEGDRKQICPCTLDPEPSSNSISFATSNGSTYVFEEVPHIQSKVNSRKRTREYRWQRQRKRKQLAVSETPSLLPSKGTPSSSNQSDMDNTANCSCCSVFQNQPMMKGNIEIDRKNIFYRIENCSSILPRKHMLHTIKPNEIGASILFNNIFEAFGPDKNVGSTPCCRTKNGCPVNSTCLYHSLTKLLKFFIRESRNCRHARLLEKHCSVRSSYQDASRGAGTVLEVAMAKNWTMIQETNTTQVEPIMCCLKNQVVSFVWAICRRIVPSQLLGERSNWRSLRRNISKFIQLRRFEKFSLKECIYKVKISKFPIFSNKHNGCLGITDTARHAIFECWMIWFFEKIVSQLLQANFYITESEHEKQEVIYFRKSIWEQLMSENECLNRYRLLNHESVRVVLWQRSFGFSRARLRPKSKGFRMLTNLRAPSRFPIDSPPRTHSCQKLWTKVSCSHRVAHRFFKSVNSVLNDVHVVLSGLRVNEPKKLGSSVFDYNDIYKKLVPFLLHLKNGTPSMPNVFMVVSDVSKAFDSVDHKKLLSVMEDVICDDEYTLEKFTQVVCTSKCLKVDPHVMLAHQDIRIASTRIRSRIRVQSFHSILVKKEVSRKIRKEEIHSLLKEHIMGNVVQLRNRFYQQLVGIPQGSILSSLLCSYYYGHMEMIEIFPFLKKAILLEKQPSSDSTSASEGNHKTKIVVPGCESLLLRFMDDYIFISASKYQASQFFTRLERGVHAYNCYMNKEKYGLNFVMDNQQGNLSNRLHMGKDNISFLPWSGLLVNCSTLEIQADYTRYLNYHLSSTLTVCRKGNLGKHLKAKLRSYLRPKCHPIFYDSNINSPGVVRLNIYQAFLLCAMKFICHLSNLSILPRFHPKFLLKAIETSLRYMNRLIRRRIYSFKGADFRPKYDVKRKDVIWLGLYAYRRVLLKKHSRYKTLLRLFSSKLKPYGEVENMPSELKYAVDDVHSSVLWSIKY